MQDSDKKNEPGVTTGKASETPPPQPPVGASKPDSSAKAQPKSESGKPSAAKPADARSSKSAKGGGFGAVLWTLLVVAVLGVAAYFTQPFWRPQLAAYLPGVASDDAQTKQSVEALVTQQRAFDEKLSAVEANLARVEEEVAALGDRVNSIPEQTARPDNGDSQGTVSGSGEPSAAAGSGTAGSVSKLSERADALETKISAVVERAQTLEQRMNALSQVNDAQKEVIAKIEQEPSATQVLLPRIEQLEADSLMSKRLADRLRELETVETQAQESAAHLTATVLSVNQLREMSNSSAPYAAQLTSLKALIGNDAEVQEEIQTLEQYADQGVPSTAALRSSYPEVASAISRTGTQVEGDGWAERTLNSLTSLVSVRRTGSAAVAAGGTEGALAQAEMSLNDGDLPAAITALQSLEDPSAAAAAQVWLTHAQARVEVDKAITGLQDFVIAQLADERS
ncbi:MAG: hypothetical protein H6905_00155 [Hyphomicrobiales bacterium]|nr:hypothetical protein [Hyphomicrobiales bacterium]